MSEQTCGACRWGREPSSTYMWKDWIECTCIPKIPTSWDKYQLFDRVHPVHKDTTGCPCWEPVQSTATGEVRDASQQ